jgi:hypothetical protein
LPASTIALDPSMDRIEQLLLAQRLGEELKGAGFDCAHGHSNVAPKPLMKILEA